jgi:hypothetical protein
MRFKGFVRQIVAVLTILVAISVVAPESFAQKKKSSTSKKSSSKKAPVKKKAPTKKKTSSSKKPTSKKKKSSKKRKSKRGRRPVRSIYYNPIPDPIILSEKNWISTPALPPDSATAITQSLLTTESIYTKDWVNAITFVYDSVEFNDLPEEIYLPHSGDSHTDHAIALKASLSCCKWFRNKHVKKIYCYFAVLN